MENENMERDSVNDRDDDQIENPDEVVYDLNDSINLELPTKNTRNGAHTTLDHPIRKPRASYIQNNHSHSPSGHLSSIPKIVQVPVDIKKYASRRALHLNGQLK